MYESVACCDDCWWGQGPTFTPNGRGVLEESVRFPFRFKQEMRVQEFCHYCGWTTLSGIYIRENTDSVPATSLRVRKEEA